MIEVQNIESFWKEQIQRNKEKMAEPGHKIILAYHASCVDGITSAAIMGLLNPEIEIFIPIQYGDPISKLIPEDAGNCDLMMVDFSLKEKELIEVCNIFNEVYIFDHHLTAENVMQNILDSKETPNNLNYYIEQRRSGAGIALQLCCNGLLRLDIDIFIENYSNENLQKIKDIFRNLDLEFDVIYRFVRLVESGDLYNFKESSSKEIGLYLKQIYKRISIIHAMDFIMNLNPYDLSEMISYGENFLKIQNDDFHFRTESLLRGLENGTLKPKKLNGTEVICLNFTGNISDFGNGICKKLNYPVCLYSFKETTNSESGETKVTFIASLRSLDILPSVEEIASSFPGGGGHRNAAGFSFEGTLEEVMVKFVENFK